jgi:cysteine-rich repeat protein
VAMQSEGDLRLDGRVKIRASTPRTATFTGCRIEVGGRVIGSPEHSSAFVGREHIHQATGSRILTGSGTNQFTYRDPAKPPLLSGVVSPAPALIVDMGLVGCPVCGNDEVDQGETCDDGNTSSGDGCSDLCQTE